MKWKNQERTAPHLSVGAAQDSKFPAFAPLQFDAFETLAWLPEPIPLPAGTLLIEQDAACDAVWLLRRGLVRLSYSTLEGDETTLGLRATGWFAGATNVMTSVPSVYSVKTVSPCLVSRIAAKDFSDALARSAKLTRHFLSSLCREVLSQSSAQARLMSERAEERLATFMRERQQRHSSWRTMDALPLLKQRELAQLLSITPEHLSRLMHKSCHDATTGSSESREWLA